MAQLIRKALRAVFNYDPSFCDMYEDAHARAVAAEYLHHIKQHLQECLGDQRLTILDAGCQAGRLLIPLAQEGHRVIGLDTSRFVLQRARRHARQQGLSIQLHQGSMAALRRWIPPASLDAVLCIEVLYLCPDYQELLRLLIESVKPGGLLCISHRPTLYYVACAVVRGHGEQAAELLTRTEGRSPDGHYHNWHTQEQLLALYRSLPLKMLGCYPIDLTPLQVDRSHVTDPTVRRFLESSWKTDSTLRVPTYFLVVAQKL